MTGLYLVFVPGLSLGPGDVEGWARLSDGLYLIRTDQTRSQLYHSIKRRHDPARLLVAPLSDLPKFKGMRAGAAREAQRLGGFAHQGST